ncbi:MAG: hypothetical protein AAB394_01385 [Patescibacteria group bacterium]
MSLQLHIRTVTYIQQDYCGSISISFSEMRIARRKFGFFFTTLGKGISKGKISKNCRSFIDFDINGVNINFLCSIDYGLRTELLCGIFLNAIRLGVGSIVSFVKQSNEEIYLPIEKEIVWVVDDNESVHGVVCLACGIEKTLKIK